MNFWEFCVFMVLVYFRKEIWAATKTLRDAAMKELGR